MSNPFAGARRQQVAASSQEWVQPTGSGPRLPFEVHPTADVKLADWAREHAAVVDRWLHEHGAVRFTGFGIGMADFAAVADAVAGSALAYHERSSPRTELAPGVYTSTDYPADQHIPLHNENSYQRSFPSRLVFCCIEAAEQGGATPLADCRRVLARLHPAVVARFRERCVRYVRNYSDGVGLSWPEAFQTTSRRTVEEYCRANGISVHWRDDGGLRTEQVRPAVAVHPVTGEHVWFNHAAFFHVSSLAAPVRAALVEQFGEDGLPATTSYGDGTPIEPQVLADIRAAYAAELVAIAWRQGDVLLVDNLLVAHGREPFTGPRRVVVSMGGSLSHADTLPPEDA